MKIFSAYTDVIGLSLPRSIDSSRSSRTGHHSLRPCRKRCAGAPGHSRRSRAKPTRTRGTRHGAPPAAEADAVDKIAELARSSGARVYFVHVSAAASVRILAARRATGQRLLAETCPHYLFLDEAVYTRTDGQRWICSPPIRGAADRDTLWDGLRDRVLDVVSSDHNCFDLAQKGRRRLRLSHGAERPAGHREPPALVGRRRAGRATVVAARS